MELPKVVIKDNFNEYLSGKEVKAALADAASAPLQPGEHVIAFKDSLAAVTDVPVPKQQQSHYIGIEGTVTHIEFVTDGPAALTDHQLLRVKKL